MNAKSPKTPAPIIRFSRFAATKGFDCNKARSRTGFVAFLSWRRNERARKRLRSIKNAAKRREGSGEALTYEIQAEHEKEYRPTHERSPGKVYVTLVKDLGVFEEHQRQNHQTKADGYVDVEDIAPGVATHDPAAQVWPDNTPHIENAAEKAYHRLSALWKLVTYNPRCRGKETRSSNALKEPACYQRIDIGCKAAGERAAGEKDKRNQKNSFAAEAITQISRQWHGHADPNRKHRHSPPRPEDVGMQVSYEVGEGHSHRGTVDGVHKKAQ